MTNKGTTHKGIEGSQKTPRTKIKKNEGRRGRAAQGPNSIAQRAFRSASRAARRAGSHFVDFRTGRERDWAITRKKNALPRQAKYRDVLTHSRIRNPAKGSRKKDVKNSQK